MASQSNTGPTSSRSSPAVNVTNPPVPSVPGVPVGHVPRPTPSAAAAVAAAAAKKGKGRKATDPAEVGKLLAAKIGQLESDAAGEKSEEAEIGEWGRVFLW